MPANTQRSLPHPNPRVALLQQEIARLEAQLE